MSLRFPRGMAPLLALGMLVAGCASPERPLEPSAVQGGQGQGGGAVTNAAPSVGAFAGSLATAANSGAVTEVFTGTVSDPNSELDLRSVRIFASGVVGGIYQHNFTVAEYNATAEPAGFGADHFKAWSGTAFDGVMHFRFRFTYPLGTAAGLATFTPNVRDTLAVLQGTGGANGTADSTTVTVFSEITVAPSPLTAAGDPSPGSWGAWSAQPGASLVASTNYIKLTNTGQKPAAEVVVDFTDSSFVGASEPGFAIPIADNLQFAWWEDTTPASSSPGEGSYAFLPANADGSVTVAFTGLDRIIYVTYRVVALPAVLPEQSYVASYTATEL